MNDMKELGITNTDDGEVLEAGSTIAAQDTADRIVDTSASMYWTAPHSYLGNRVSHSWVKVFRINPEFRILRPTFYGKSASKC